MDNRSDLDALLELRDIEDELTTIGKLFGEQSRGIHDMQKIYQDLNTSRGQGLCGLRILKEASHTLHDYQEQVDGMLKSTQAAQQAFKDLLDMKQKQANVVEAHLAREQTEVAAEQSRSVMVFTIFTIIFLPLSFFASIFGINAREWTGVSDNVSLRTIFIYMGPISVGVILVALLVAFNRLTRKLVQSSWKQLAAPLYNVGQRVMGKIRNHKRGRFSRKKVDTERGLEETNMAQDASEPNYNPKALKYLDITEKEKNHERNLGIRRSETYSAGRNLTC